MLPRLPLHLAIVCALALAPAAHAQLDRTGWQTELSELAHEVRGVVTIVDADTIRLDNFYYDGLGLEVYVTLAKRQTDASFAQGLRVGKDLVGNSFANDTLILDLPKGETVDDYRAVSIWCATIGMNFGSGQFRHPWSGWRADLSTLAHDVDGIATVVDHETIRIDQFDYDGKGVGVYATLAVENTDASISVGLPISDDLVGTPLQNASEVYTLPPGARLEDYSTISIWCTGLQLNFGSGEFERSPELRVDPFLAGTETRLRLSGMTPSQPVVVAYSLRGPGPSFTRFGWVDLTQPIHTLPKVTTTVSGSATIRTVIPKGTVGQSVWLQGIDLASGKLTRMKMRTIQ